MARKIIVQKYGGSSVADVPRLKQVAQRVAETCQQGKQVVVVVSAMGNTTNELLALARRVTNSPGRRELDMLISVGERITMTLLSMAVADLGLPAVSFTGSQSGIITDERHAAARVIEVRPERVLESLASGQVVIVAGFQGVSRHREVTTLGRGGSDTTAVALAAAIGAECCEICSDVDGVFSADPRQVPQARRLAHLSYEEALALLRGGAKVLHAEAAAFAAAHGIELRAVATSGSTGGTTISAARPGSPPRVAAVTTDAELDLVRPGPDGLWPLLRHLEQVEAPVRAVRSDSALIDRRDFHHRDTVRWPAGTRLEPVCLATAAGRGCGRAALLQLGAQALQDAGIEPLGGEADGDRLAWLLPAGCETDATAALHAALVEPGSSGTKRMVSR